MDVVGGFFEYLTYLVPFSTHLKELRDSTNDILYENYRTAKLAILARESVAGSVSG